MPPDAGQQRGWWLWKRVLLGSVVVIVCTAAATATAALLEVKSVTDALKESPALKVGSVLTTADPGSPQTILIIGSDKRAKGAGIDATSPPHSDTMLLVHLDASRGVSMLSVPRDLKVTIKPDHGTPSTQKINAAYSIGGDKLAAETVNRVLHVQINHIVDVSFFGFKKAVDFVHCVYVDVDRRYFNDNSQGGAHYATINVQPGYQKLCGSDALDYVRYRHTDTDLVRNARQQDFLHDAKDQLGVQGLIDNRTALERIFGRFTQTDVHSNSAVLRLLALAVQAAAHPFHQVHFRSTLGPSYVTATESQLRATVREFLYGDVGPPAPRSAAPPTPSRTAHAVPLTPAVSSDLATARAEARALPYQLYYPLRRVQTSGTPDLLRLYQMPDEQGHLHHSYRVVISRGVIGEYYGLQGTDWMHPPILQNPTETTRIGGRSYQLFYEGHRLRVVAWKTPRAVYWVSNTLEHSLTYRQMLAIAASAAPV